MDSTSSTPIQENIIISQASKITLADNLALMQQIDAANDMLRKFRKQVIQEKKVEKDNKIIGQITYGFKPQYVVDATNRTVGPLNWKYEEIDEIEKEKQFIKHLQFYVKAGGEWLNKGSMFGVGQIVRTEKTEAITDAKKSAIVNAVQKCLALMSIGTDAYRGLLKPIYHGKEIEEKYCLNNTINLESEMDFMSRVLAIDKELDDYGMDAIQKKSFGNVQYGYKPQYVFDAVNRNIGPANWRYTVQGYEVTGSVSQQASVAIRVQFLVDSEWFDKGVQYGVTPIVYDNVGDAFKGAIVNGIQKCFAAYSIGSKSYRGLLQTIYENISPVPPKSKKSANKQQTPPAANQESRSKPQNKQSENQPVINETPEPKPQSQESENIQFPENDIRSIIPTAENLKSIEFVKHDGFWQAKARGRGHMEKSHQDIAEKHGFFWHEHKYGERTIRRFIYRIPSKKQQAA